MAELKHLVGNPAGRLVAARLVNNVTLESVHVFARDVGMALAAQRGEARLVVDTRAIPIVSQEVADAYVALMRSDSSAFFRSAVLGSDDPQKSAALQKWRVVREAGVSKRSFFDKKDALIEWMAQFLDPTEEQALKIFLGK